MSEEGSGEPGERSVLSGWGRTSRSTTSLCRPVDAASVSSLLRSASPVVARGLGRSYGDAAQCTGGLTVEMTGLSRIGELDQSSGTIEVEAGVALHDLLCHVIPSGWFVGATPGTRFVTVGGAIAADVHGKNHHRDGSFANYVLEMTLATPSGVVRASRCRDPELFWATAGGMGLTGVIVAATLQLIPIETSLIQVESTRYDRLDDLMGAMEDADDAFHYSVAWLDCTAHRRGRVHSILSRGEHAAADTVPSGMGAGSNDTPRPPQWRVQRLRPLRLVNRATIRAFNEMWFRAPWAAPTGLCSLSSFFYPLDRVADWNLLYGSQGFVQYQFAVPARRGDAVGAAVEAIGASGLPSALSVLKRFGQGTPGPLSFSQEGWTLAVDFPVGPAGLEGLLDGLDQIVAGAGGRVYLAKDARLRPEVLPEMYPRLGEMADVCRRVDPEGLLQSDLSRRLGIPR